MPRPKQPPRICSYCDKKFKYPSEVNRHVRQVHTGEKYKCQTCQVGFTYKSLLDRHLEICSSEETVSINYERAQSILAKSRQAKNLAKLDKKSIKLARNFSCSICSRKFSLLSNLNRHNFLVHGSRVKIFAGQKLSEKCAGEKLEKEQLSENLVKVSKKQLNSKIYTCGNCFKTFYSHANLKVHFTACEAKKIRRDILMAEKFLIKLDNFEEKMGRKYPGLKILKNETVGNGKLYCFQCKICDSRYQHLQSYFRHLKLKKKLKCERCYKNFPTYCAYKLHTTQDSCSGKNLKIIQPKLTLDQQNQMKNMYKKLVSKNMLMQSAAKENLLLEVNYEALKGKGSVAALIAASEPAKTSAKNSGDLEKPELLNSKKRGPYKHKNYKIHTCQFCQKQIKKKSDFVRHENSCGGVKNFTCPTCQKTYTSQSQLNQHQKLVHEKSLRLECHLCQKNFANKSSLKVHMKKHLTKA